MANLWSIPEINVWWLPNDEGCPAVVRSIRSFMEDRLPQAASKVRSDDQRNIKAIFSRMTLKEEEELHMMDRGIVCLPPVADIRKMGSLHLGKEANDSNNGSPSNDLSEQSGQSNTRGTQETLGRPSL